MGARDEATAKKTARRFVEVVKHVHPDFDCGFFNFRVRNITTTTAVNFPLNLNLLYETLRRSGRFPGSGSVSFEPELFPGLTCKPGLLSCPSMELKIFSTGKITTIGSLCLQDTINTVSYIFPWVYHARKKRG